MQILYIYSLLSDHGRASLKFFKVLVLQDRCLKSLWSCWWCQLSWQNGCWVDLWRTHDVIRTPCLREKCCILHFEGILSSPLQHHPTSSKCFLADSASFFNWVTICPRTTYLELLFLTLQFLELCRKSKTWWLQSLRAEKEQVLPPSFFFFCVLFGFVLLFYCLATLMSTAEHQEIIEHGQEIIRWTRHPQLETT